MADGFLPALISAFRPPKIKDLRAVSDRGGWFSIFRESYPGAWQQNVTVDFNTVLSFPAVFSSMTMIANDIAKLRPVLRRRVDGVWIEAWSPTISPVLRKPNHYQNRIQFFASWCLSKLMRGNTYVLLMRDGRGAVSRMYVLDPNHVRPLVSDVSEEVFYELRGDSLSELIDVDRVVVPARDIIHDRTNCLFHPLVGVSPLYAAGLVASQGISIQKSSTWFFGNKSIPGGVLTAPGEVSDATAARLKETWETKFGGDQAGKIAVLGDGLKFEPMTISASDSQLVEQLKYTAEIICSTFHIPPYKLGIGPMPTNNNVQALNIEYYSTCLQSPIEEMEICLDEALGTGEEMGVEFEVDGLLRMDTKTQMEVEALGVTSAIKKPNESRARFNLSPVEGGDTPYLQQQNFGLAALAERDRNKPFAKPEPAAPAAPAAEAAAEQDDEEMRALMTYAIRGLLEDKLNAA